MNDEQNAFAQDILDRYDREFGLKQEKGKTPKSKASTAWPPEDPEEFFAEVRALSEKEEK